MKRRTTLLACLSSLLLALPAAAQEDEFPCEGVLDAPEQLTEILVQVPRYASTYVLVFKDEIADQVLALDSPALGQLRVAAYDGSAAAEMAGRVGLTGLDTRPFDLAAAGQIVDEVLADELDVGLVWAPLAGLAALELDFNYELSLLTAGEPAPAPSAFAGAAAGAAPSACAEEIAAQLGGYGVVPAEKLVKLDIREILHLPAPPRDVTAAREGSALYAEHCAKCHGPEAVAAQDALAPVDLLVSTPRFSYPGFLYIVLNGRSQNGMPGFRGTLSRDDVQQIYQYARERSHGVDLSSR